MKMTTVENGQTTTISTTEVIITKQSNTLKNNMDQKDDVPRKRTSIQIVPHRPESITSSSSHSPSPSPSPPTSNQIQNDMTNLKSTLTNNNNNINNDSKKSCNQSTTAANIINNVLHKDQVEDLKNKNVSNRNSIASVNSSNSVKSSSTTTASSVSNGCPDYQDDVEDGDYVNRDEEDDLNNGNNTEDDDKKRLSSSSSGDDYYLREKFQNIVNESLAERTATNGINNNSNSNRNSAISNGGIAQDAILSPHEGPMGRRYAEIVQFKSSKWYVHAFLLFLIKSCFRSIKDKNKELRFSSA